ncbi:MAG TPA: hypothetical protein VK430_12330 [Xanthobacteraceae bacterium]|nr:hypothetical protein [Xanthobacteraceae bacterium]
MAEPRKVFRIEETAAMRLEPQVDDAPAPVGQAEMMRELNALRALFAAAATRPSTAAAQSHEVEVERLGSALDLIRAILGGSPRQRGELNGSRQPKAPATRIARELEAVRTGTEEATQEILAAAEDIDHAATNLSAALGNETERGLARDIRDRVVRIFEACNFQDLTSQRIAKVMATLIDIEEEITRALAEIARTQAAPTLHGPPLEHDRGHAAQSDVDILFGGGD